MKKTLKLKRSDCALLYLTLKRKWYDMIANGVKEEEYRDYKPFWTSRIDRWSGQINKHRVAAFSLGRRKPDMFFLCMSKGCEAEPVMLCLSRYALHPEWGEPRAPHYTIPLDERVELEDESEVVK